MIEPVGRADDSRIGDYARVGDHHWLRDRGLFVAEGRLVLGRLLQSGRFDLHSVLLTPAALESFGGSLATTAPVYVAPQDVLNEITGFNFHRGCLALAHRHPAAAPGGLEKERLLLALEGVGNPDNVGGLFRVAAAFGAGGILLDPASGDPFYRKAVRTSMGAILHVPFERLGEWPDGLVRYKAAGFSIVALTPSSDARPMAGYAREAGSRLIVMLGAEGPGLSAAALSVADERVRIPIAPAVDSLNVVVAAGIALSWLAAPS